EAADDVRSAGDGGQVNIRLDVIVDEVEALRSKRRARRQHGPERREVVRGARLETGLLQRIDVLGRRAEVGAAFLRRVIPKDAAGGMERRAVVEQECR